MNFFFLYPLSLKGAAKIERKLKLQKIFTIFLLLRVKEGIRTPDL